MKKINNNLIINFFLEKVMIGIMYLFDFLNMFKVIGMYGFFKKEIVF